MKVWNLFKVIGGGLLALGIQDMLKGPRLGILSEELQINKPYIDRYRKETGDYTSSELKAYQKMCIRAYRKKHNDYTSSDDKIWHDRLRRR